MSDGRREVEYFHNLARSNEKIPTLEEIKEAFEWVGGGGMCNASTVGVLLAEIDRLQEELEEQLEAKGHIGKQAQAYCKMADENRAKFLSAQQDRDSWRRVSERLEGEKQKLIAEIKNFNNGLRPEVQWFAQRMEAKLKANDHKPHWEGSAINELVYCLTIELAELRLAIEKGESAEDIINEAADVANFAMMIADNAVSKY